MAIPRIPKDGEALAADHRRLLAEMEAGSTLPEVCRGEVLTGAEVLAQQDVDRILSEIPVEKLNRSLRGIRTKTLRDQGITDLAKARAVSERTLEAINGISAAGAAEIKAQVEILAKQAREGARIRLNFDARTAQADALVLSLSRYRRAVALPCGDLRRSHEKEIRGALRDLEPGKNFFTWMFAGKERKLAAHAGYALLREKLLGDYGETAKQAAREIAAIQALTPETAWEDLRRDPVPFFTTLEQLCPGMVGTDQEIGGLPEELAKRIQDQPLALEGLRCQLRRYQLWGVKYILCQKRVLLGDEMGLGKTVQAIAAMVDLRNGGSTHFLVVCPASVAENWCRELRKHSDLEPVKIHGSNRETSFARWLASGGVGVTTYETTANLRLPEGFSLSMAVVDEAHYIKNPQAQRSLNVRRLCRQAERLLFMTGTALENRVDEMLSILRVLQPEVAARAETMASLSAAPQFRQEIAPVYYRRKREDVLTELPDLVETQEWCELHPGERRCYEQAVLADRFMDARRVSWNAPGPSAKAERLLELAEEAREEGRKLIVFSFFLDTIARVVSLLGERCMEPISGSVPPLHRQEILDAFEQAPVGAVLPAQIQAGGTGLNIQCASVVILCEPQLKPSLESQAISRAYRMGQTRNVLVYRLLCENTVDERITELLEQKQRAFDAFADESAAAEESMELDEKTMKAMMDREARRIRAQNSPEEPE